MLPFKKPASNTRPGATPEPSPPASDDLLAQREADEFTASVSAAQARARARSHAAACPKEQEKKKESPRPPEIEDEIQWSEQEDVYRPEAADGLETLRALGVPGSISLRHGESLVLIRTAAFQTARSHVGTDTTVELGGLLIGRVFHDPVRALYLTLAEAALPAQGGESTATSFTYTPASWQALMPVWTQTIGNGTIVGSYHSHPGMGIFMSATDLETQTLVFPYDWQVALVLDPVARTEGFFIGASGRPCRAALC